MAQSIQRLDNLLDDLSLRLWSRDSDGFTPNGTRQESSTVFYPFFFFFPFSLLADYCRLCSALCRCAKQYAFFFLLPNGTVVQFYRLLLSAVIIRLSPLNHSFVIGFLFWKKEKKLVLPRFLFLSFSFFNSSSVSVMKKRNVLHWSRSSSNRNRWPSLNSIKNLRKYNRLTGSSSSSSFCLNTCLCARSRCYI